MKRIFTVQVMMFAALLANATVVTDTVSTGASYANQIWYSLANDEQGSNAKDNWDLAFETTGYTGSILANTQKGLAVYQSPYAVAQWASVDTIGIENWASLQNSDIAWEEGALNSNPDGNLDLGWGVYDMNTHVITGDSIYVVKLASGAWKKLRINSLSSGSYSFTYADLDGSNEQNATLAKSAYATKNFGYYSLETNTELDREPATTLWDVTFTKYMTTIYAPTPTPYGVTGLLLNKGVFAVKAAGVDVNTVDYNNYTVQSDINTIGYDWKSFAGTWTLQDSLVYFVQPANGDIWKLIFTGFGGSTTGNYIFSKELVYTAPTGITNVEAANMLGVYPNPTKGAFKVVYNTTQATTLLRVLDLAGRQVYTEQLNSINGLNETTINASGLTPGIYLVAISGTTAVQKLIVE